MNTKALRQKILDLAIHGKLLPLEKVEQIRKDEPASKLLEKIRAEKQEKIAKGELKKDKNDSFIFVGNDKRHYEKFANGTVKDIEDEIPFEVPEGWSWCRLGEIALDMADGPFGSNLKTEHYTTKKEARLIQLSNIGEEGWRESNTKYTTFEHAKNNIARSIVESGNIVIAKMMPAGRAIICPNNEKMYVLSSDAVKLIPSNLTYSKYLLNAINSPSFRNLVTDNVQGSTRLRTSISKLKVSLLPLPPLAEQKLIVEEIEKIFAQIDLLEQNKTDLQTAIKQAKSKILDLAIHGKLVPQDPNDEPASVLLEKIRAEKEEKIAKGELKRDKNDSFIYKSTTDNCHYQKNSDGSIVNIEDEIPFEVPDGWSWCRLGEITNVKSSKRVFEKDYVSTGIPFYRSLEIGQLYRNEKISQSLYITKEHYEELKRNYGVPSCGDILITSVGSIGNTWICDEREFYYKDGNVTQICKSEFFYSKYMNYFLHSNLMNKQVSDTVSGSAYNALTIEKLKNLFLPLPPLAEQTRIVAKIEELFSQLDSLESNLV